MKKIENPLESFLEYMETHEWKNDGKVYAIFCECTERKDLSAIIQGLNNAIMFKRSIDRVKSEETEVSIYWLSKEDLLDIVQEYIIDRMEK